MNKTENETFNRTIRVVIVKTKFPFKTKITSSSMKVGELKDELKKTKIKNN